MGCACKGKKTQFQVIADGGNGKVLFSSGSKATAEAVSKRYPNSKVVDPGTPATTAVAKPDAPAEVAPAEPEPAKATTTTKKATTSTKS